jgi:hypothetical protein
MNLERGARHAMNWALGAFSLAAMAAIVVATACSQSQPAPPGQLVVALDTDMALPDQIDTIELIVSTHGSPLLDLPLPVGKGADTQPIPATLTLVAGPDPSVPATIQVIGWKNGVARTIRQVVTTVPTNRAATLRMPIQWLCDGTTQTVPTADGGVAYQSSCGNDATCKQGECVASQVDSNTLTTFTPQIVFGGGSAPSAGQTTTGSCFDTLPCMLAGTVEAPDDQCTVELPPGGNVNVALRVAGNGICDTTGTTCFVPLDQDPDEGWSIQDGRIALPSKNVCTKLRDGEIAGVVVSTGCPTKTPSIPPCGAWSSVAPPVDGGTVVITEAGPPPMPTIVSSLVPDGGAGGACCPLMADSRLLYTCTCQAGAPVQIVSIDPTTGATASVGTFTPQDVRTQYAAVLASGEVWWADRKGGGDAGTSCSVQGTSSTDGGTGPALGVVQGDIYDGADILGDAANLYFLADNVSGVAATASPVQLIRMARATGEAAPLDTGGAVALLQFTQDMDSVYAGVDTDVAVDGGVERISQIMQFPKSGMSGTPLARTTITTKDAAHGGFIGLQSDGASLFALFEAPPMTDGTINTQVLRLDPSDAGSATLYDDVVTPQFERLRLLGAVSGAAVLVRDVNAGPDSGVGAPTQSSVLVIPPGAGAPRIIASFINDTPLFELQAPAFSPDTFWVNRSGKVFRLPAAAVK